MGKRMSGSVLLLTMLAFSLIVGDVLMLAAQDPPATPPATQTETPKPKPRTSKKARGEVTTTETTGDQTAATPAQTTTARTAPTEQTDLSGTYAGTFTCDPLGINGDTTLTITGNQFTTADGKSGRIVASTTSGYTAVALQTGEVGTGTTAATPPTIVSLRARKSGNRLTLMPVAGSAEKCSFSPARNVARTRRSRDKTPAATGAEVASPAEAGPTPADVTGPAKPARTRRGSTRRAGTTTTPATMPSPTTMPAPTQTPSPEPSPTPAPSPTPTPSPEPTGSPTPEPAPTATPSPTPSPSPSPSPGRRG